MIFISKQIQMKVEQHLKNEVLNFMAIDSIATRYT